MCSQIGHFGWPKITFDRISHHFRSICKMAASGHFGSRLLPKSIGTSLYSRSVATSNMKLIGAFWITLWSAQAVSSDFLWFLFYKMAGDVHFEWPKIPFNCISRHFRSILSYFFLNFVTKWAVFWMTENHFWSPFQMNTSHFFHKMAAVGHFGFPKITFNYIARHFRSIGNFYFWGIYFYKMDAGGHFRWPNITFDRIARHFRSIHCICLEIFHKMAAGVHFIWPKITFDRISRHFRLIRSFHFFGNVFTKWPPASILDDRKSLWIAFLAISDQYATFIFWNLFTQWRPAAILDDRKSLSIAFLAISDQYATFIFWNLFTQWRPAAILDDRKSLLIAFLAISDQYATYLFEFFFKMPFWIPILTKIDRDLPLWLHQIWNWSVHFWLSYEVHKLFHHIFTKWPPAVILVLPIFSKIDRVLPL